MEVGGNSGENQREIIIQMKKLIGYGMPTMGIVDMEMNKEIIAVLDREMGIDMKEMGIVDMEMKKDRQINSKMILGDNNPGAEPSNNGNVASEIHGNVNLNLLNAEYSLLKSMLQDGFWRENEIQMFLPQISPMGNTVLHIVAMHGFKEEVRKVVIMAPNLLTIQNSKGDTALHVAAKAGHFSCVKTLLVDYLQNLPIPYSENPKQALEEILVRNNQGNTFFHEAVLNGRKDVFNLLISDEIEDGFKELLQRTALFRTNKEDKSALYLAIERGYTEVVNHTLTIFGTKHTALENLIRKHQELANMIPLCANHASSAGGLHHREGNQMEDGMGTSRHLIPYGPNFLPPGKSPLLAAILKKDLDILQVILLAKKDWIQLMDSEGRTPLHYAASVGYLEGVNHMLAFCNYCSIERDNHGLFPLHLASAGGHYEVVREFLKHCPDPREILDNYGRNFLHIAAENGRFNVINYILQQATDTELLRMINDKDANGNTPLHLATLHCHPKIVLALTWDTRMDLTLTNIKNQTALDTCLHFIQENPSLGQRLTWIALKSAGVKCANKRSNHIKVPQPPQSEENVWKRMRKAPNMDEYKDRINTLMLVSTLIITVTFAAGFTLPGGINTSDPHQGMALFLNHTWFNVFIFCITISMYGGISVTVILIWAQLGDITLALLALKVARPLLGITLATLSLAFMAGVHLVISDLSWLATTFLAMCVIFVLMLLLLYTLLWFPSSSSNRIVRYISYYPFLFLASLVDPDENDADEQPQKPNN